MLFHVKAVNPCAEGNEFLWGNAGLAVVDKPRANFECGVRFVRFDMIDRGKQ